MKFCHNSNTKLSIQYTANFDQTIKSTIQVRQMIFSLILKNNIIINCQNVYKVERTLLRNPCFHPSVNDG